MDDYLEIDIKKLIKNLLSRWQWIIGVTLLAGIAVFLMFYLKEDTFEAKSKIALIQPRFEAQFNSNITTSDITMPSEGFITNAVMSNDILVELFAAWSNPEKSEIPLEQFAADNLTVSFESKGAIVILISKARTPEEAASLANLWAELAIKEINSTYYGIDIDKVEYFKDQTEKARLAHVASGEALVEYAKNDDSDFLQIQLDNLKAKSFDKLQRHMVFESAVTDVTGLVKQLEKSNPDAPVSPSDQLNFTLITTRVYGSPVVTGLAGSPVQLQLVVDSSGEALTNREFIATMNNWIEVLQTAMIDLETESTTFASQANQLQSTIKAINLERSLLETDHSLKESTFRTLNTKLEEITLNFDTGDANAKLLSEALPPQEAIPHNTVRNTLIALIAAGVLTSVAILLIDWWKTDE